MEKDLMSLSKDERQKTLKEDVLKKERLRKNLYPLNVQMTDQEIEKFFEETDGYIHRISESPSFIHNYVKENKLVQKTARTDTIKFKSIEEAIDFVKGLRFKIVYFYDLIKVRDEFGNENIHIRIAEVDDEGHMMRERRESRIDEILEIINKPR